MTIKERFAEIGTHIKYHDNEVAALEQCQKTVVTQIVTHGDFDGIATAAMLAKDLGLVPAHMNVIFTQPFLVDQVEIPEGIESVYICDIAVNNRNPKMTWDFIKRLEESPAKFHWYDHHIGWGEEAGWDPHFTTHADLPAMAAYFCDSTQMELRADAIVADTREGTMSPTGQMIEDAMKSDLSNDAVKLTAVKFMLGDESQRPMLEDAARKYAAVLNETNRLANNYDVDGKPMSFFRSGRAGNSQVPGKDYTGKVAVVDARESNHKYDLTQLLLKGQDIATFAVAKTVNTYTGEENITIATKSGVNLVELFNLGSGAPFRVTLPIDRLDEAIEKIGGD